MTTLSKPLPRRSYRKPLICCVSFLLAFFADTAINFACGPEADPYDYYISFFHNNPTDTKAYQPFLFTNYEFLYDYEEPASEHSLNSQEWADYLGKSVSPADVEKVMYQLDGRTDTLVYDGKVPDSLKSNTFLQTLTQKKFKNALAYYCFAKNAEPYATVENAWDPELRDTLRLAELGNQATQSGKTAKDNFLKLRYFYQAQRLLRYAGKTDEARDIYARYISKIASTSRVKGWSLALQAGTEPDSVRSAYLFSRVFELYPERRVQAYLNYRYTHATGNHVLAMAKNDSEKATIYAIEGLGDPRFDLHYLKEIYGCEPASPVISVLLAREVNKLEEAYLDPKISKALSPIKSPVFSDHYYGDDINRDSIQRTAKDHIKALREFCDRFFRERKSPDYGLGKITSAYLAWMQQDTKVGLADLAALNSVKLRTKLDDQKQITKLLLIAQGIQRYNEVNEAALLPSLQWLDEKVKAEAKANVNIENYRSWSNYSQRPFVTTARNFYQSILAPAYYKQGMISKAAAAIAKGAPIKRNEYPDRVTLDFWQNSLQPSSVLRLIQWKHTPPQNAFMNLLVRNLFAHQDDDLYELLGTTYLREHLYDKAVSAFKNVGPKRLDTLWTIYLDEEADSSDPFISRLADYPKVWLQPGSKRYNKLQFAEAMAALQQKMKASPHDPAAYFKYATGLYNTGMHGNSWYYISYNWAAADAGRPKEHGYDDDYVHSINAEKYFLLARASSKDAEFKAKCTFMAAKCQQKQIIHPAYAYYYLNGYNYDEYQRREKQYGLMVRRNPYFGELNKSYYKTKFYKQAVTDCSYLRDFIRTQVKQGIR